MRAPTRKSTRGKPLPRNRGGYMLLMCLLVVAVSSSIVLTLFQMLQLQTAEALARRQLVVVNSLNDAALEHAVAILSVTPAFRGEVGPIIAPTTRASSYTLRFVEVNGDVRIDAILVADGVQRQTSRLIPAADINTRRQRLGLAR